jgi:hypothetical protein
MPSFPGAPINGGQDGGRKRRGTRRHGMSVKALKRALKSKGLKTTGKKAALTKRAKKAHLLRGGACAKEGEVGYDPSCKDGGRGRRRGGAPCGPGQTPDVDGCE